MMELHLPPKNAKPDLLLNLNVIKSFGAHPLQTDDFDSSCSTPYVSAPSSPVRRPVNGGGSGFFYSCPASPMRFPISKTVASCSCASSPDNNKIVHEFEFSARLGSSGSGQPGSMSSADELFLNGKIRPMKLSTHLEQPQVLAPLVDLEDEEFDRFVHGARGRDLRVLSRRARSLSPLRRSDSPFNFLDDYDEEEISQDFKNVKKIASEVKNDQETAPSSSSSTSVSGSTSRSSSAGRNNAKRWVFLKDFLHRSKSEGRRSNNKFWSNISSIPTPAKEKKSSNGPTSLRMEAHKGNEPVMGSSNKKPINGVGKRRMVPPPASPHELHYKASRAQAEEMRKRTFLPYRQGLIGSLGFNSKSYGIMHGFARALNPVSSR